MGEHVLSKPFPHDLDSDRPLTIKSVRAHPLSVRLAVPQKSSKGAHQISEILVVEVETTDGIIGLGEGFCRISSRLHAAFVDQLLAPRIIGRDARDRRALWKAMRATISGQPGGQIVEAIAAIDIALWDIMGHSTGLPVHRLLGGMGRTEVQAYASSVMWADDKSVAEEVQLVLDAGYNQIKIKIGNPVEDAIARAHFVRRLVGDSIRLYADGNWAFDVDDALRVSHGLADAGYDFFEEPIVAHDREGYKLLSRRSPIRLAAGEADYVSGEALTKLADRSVGLIQPDIARSGGITETWRIAELAAAHHTAFAPHMGLSGAICAAASLHISAAAETFRTYESMYYENPLRTELCDPVVGERHQLVDGKVPVPKGPGLGVSLNRKVLERYRAG
ncbi:mandelate racemase/muconate lactonizing enzyme family protein [Microvirga pudoricolor]|uniref:mandelate racemase/muconate lactonizing enzyme family protein n=1 Tax=Microvirga pudoricolor TaxID=2778729 RepID=UPI00194F1DC1|nr:mandelate racemase/muconate lactonizing enzyme family protein [Microvirga pudoricolor]MBM6596374.1 mandelate racemase/muconate lactonizing enzyme family protein [Microvirga pudoricolor]